MTRVLLVEDHRLVAQALEMGLRREGFEVRSTDGAPNCLPVLLAEFPADVVLLDLYLADRRSGIDLLPILKEPGRRIIVLTGESDPTVLAGALAAGADAVLDKAIPFPELVRELSAILLGESVAAEARRHQVLRDARAGSVEALAGKGEPREAEGLTPPDRETAASFLSRTVFSAGERCARVGCWAGAC